MKNHLSIYLIKENITDEKMLFSNEPDLLHEFSEDKKLFYLPSKVKGPKWLRNFFGLVNQNLKLANSRAVLFLKLTIGSSKRIFILSFGHGKYMLADNVTEERFGLITLLNMISEDDIRKITKINIGGNLKTSDEQIPISSNINDFGFDVNRDLMKKVTAIIEDSKYGKCVITGGDIFSFTIESDIDSIENDLTYLYKKYKDNQYKKRFSWINNITPVKDKTIIMNLDNEYIKAIKNKKFNTAWLTVPEIVKWEDTVFRYSGNKTMYDDINIETFLEIHDDIENIDKLKNKKIHVETVNGEMVYKTWNAYKCAFAEVEYEDKTYCLNNGKWFNIDSDFVKEINEDYNSTPVSELNLIDYNHENEGSYNKDLTSHITGAVCLDKKNIMYGGGSNRIELCDILTKEKQLIHIKHNGGSSYMSHLFNQATNSGEYLTDPRFRLEVKKKFEELKISEKYDKSFDPKNYTVIMGIIDKKNNEIPHIPFFSKVSIQYAKRRLLAFGYKVEIKNIVNKKEVN